jgi:hypothetical protein
MNKKLKALAEELTKALESASASLLENSCTCVDRSDGHQPDCSGLREVEDHDKLVEKAKKILAEKPSGGTTFPMEYKGWKIEIKMGREFKGARGSVKNKRGYVAIRISDLKTVEFAPSYDTTPSVQAVKIMIDMEERATALYKT